MGSEDIVVPAEALDSMISKLEEALAGLEGAFAGVWSYLLPDAKICMGELELIREVIQALKQRAAEGHLRRADAAGALKSFGPAENGIATR